MCAFKLITASIPEYNLKWLLSCRSILLFRKHRWKIQQNSVALNPKNHAVIYTQLFTISPPSEVRVNDILNFTVCYIEDSETTSRRFVGNYVSFKTAASAVTFTFATNCCCGDKTISTDKLMKMSIITVYISWTSSIPIKKNIKAHWILYCTHFNYWISTFQQLTKKSVDFPAPSLLRGSLISFRLWKFTDMETPQHFPFSLYLLLRFQIPPTPLVSSYALYHRPGLLLT